MKSEFISKTPLTPDQELATAIYLAAKVHLKQRDKGDEPYILHPLKVMEKLHTKNYQKRAIGVLHDVVEDSNGEEFEVTIDDLRDFGFSERVVLGVDAMTRKEGQSQEEYEEQVLGNDDAVDVKTEDIDHNSRMTRLKGLRDKDFARVIKYQKFYARLVASKENRARKVLQDSEH